MVKKPLRFASWIRVSTEQQAKQGESLRTQHIDNEGDINLLGGAVVGQYGGQEHATPGWERQEFDRMLEDAGRNKFDAIIMNHIDRWSRDGKKHYEGRDILKLHGIRFFVRTTEYDLDDDDDFRMGIDVLFAQRNARIQNRKSLKNKIARAKRNIPCSGSLPFGRTFDSTGQWGVIPEVKVRMEDIARRYLAGESIYDLADEYGVKVTTIYERLKNCGPTWVLKFDSDELKIHETVPLTVPPLLDDKTIQAIRKRVEANTTYHHGHMKYQYLFSRMAFCGHCGSSMSGQFNNGVRYYRHLPKAQATCPFKGNVRADDLETAVMFDLFHTFGNPLAVQRAIEEANPKSEQAEQDRIRLQRLDAELAKIRNGRADILKLVGDGGCTKQEAAKKLEQLKQRETNLAGEAERLQVSLENVLDAQQIKVTAEQCATLFNGQKIRCGSAKLWAKTSKANDDLEGMSWDDKRALVEMVFSGKTTEGKRMGIYIDRLDGQRAWKFAIRGHLIYRFGKSPISESRLEEDPEYGLGFVALEQDALLKKLSVVTRPGPWGPIRRQRCFRLCRSRRRGDG